MEIRGSIISGSQEGEHINVLMTSAQAELLCDSLIFLIDSGDGDYVTSAKKSNEFRTLYNELLPLTPKQYQEWLTPYVLLTLCRECNGIGLYDNGAKCSECDGAGCLDPQRA